MKKKLEDFLEEESLDMIIGRKEKETLMTRKEYEELKKKYKTFLSDFNLC